MKVQRTSAYASRRNMPRSRTVPMQAVRDLLARIFNRAAPEVGTVLDFADLTDAKLRWRKNLLTETEFRNGLADAPARSTEITASTIAGYGGAIQFPTAPAGTQFAYKTLTLPPGTVVSMQLVVEMGDDLGAPAVGDNAPGNDASIVLFGIPLAVNALSVSPLGGRQFLVKAQNRTVTGATPNYGVVRYLGNSTRSMKVTAYQLDLGPVCTPYQKLTDVSTEFLLAFPFHSLFQDNVGALAMYAPEQPIGLALDLRFGGLRGPELCLDPTLDNPAAWTTVGATPSWVVADGRASVTATATASRWLSGGNRLTVGKTYEIFLDATIASGSMLPDVSATPTFATTSGRKHWIIVATISTLQFIANPAFVGSIDNITVREVYGAHATQATVGDRPISDGKTNLLQNSQADTMLGNGTTPPTVTNRVTVLGESCSVAVFTAAMTAGFAGSRMDGAGGANQIRGNVISGQPYTWQYRIALSRALIGGETLNCNFTGSAGLTVFQITAANSAAFVGQLGLVSAVTEAVAASGSNYPVVALGTALSSDLTVSVCKAQMVFGRLPLAYQRVGVPTDYDAVGFPKGARFNGVNSWMSIASMDLSSTDKILVGVSYRKDADPTTSIDAALLELGAIYTAAGRFVMASSVGGSNQAGWYLRGSTGSIGASVTVLPGSTVVLTGAVDWNAATPNRIFRINGQYAGGTPGTNVGGTTQNGDVQPLYIGRRAGSGTSVNGVIYRVDVRGTAFDNVMAANEAWLNQPAKAY